MSTVLRMMGGFEKPSAGSIHIDGNDVTRLAPERRPTGMVLQSHALWTHMDVFTNVAFGLKLRRIALAASAASTDTLAQRALDAGAFVSIVHPGWYGLTLSDALALPNVHAVEAYNSICDWETGRGDGNYLIDQMLNKGHRLGVLATDDAHRYGEEACRGWVMVKAETCTPQSIMAALKAGAYYASQGPAIHHVEIDGDHLNVETSAVRSVWLVGHAARSAVVMGRGIARARLPLEKFSGGWTRLIIADEQGRRA